MRPTTPAIALAALAFAAATWLPAGLVPDAAAWQAQIPLAAAAFGAIALSLRLRGEGASRDAAAIPLWAVGTGACLAALASILPGEVAPRLVSDLGVALQGLVVLGLGPCVLAAPPETDAPYAPVPVPVAPPVESDPMPVALAA